MTNDGPITICAEHACCIHVPHVQASEPSSPLTGVWHLRWMPDDSAWFLVPPQGNVREIRVSEGTDPAGALAVEGVPFESIREEIARNGLFPPC
jgi:hypothetical protein